MKKANLILFVSILFFVYVLISSLAVAGLVHRRFDFGLIFLTQMIVLAGMVLLAMHGTTRKSPLFWPIIAMYIVAIVGSIFKILHWPWANELLWGSLCAAFVMYFLAFLLKKQKGQLDVVKIVWFAIATLGTAGIIMHLLPVTITYLRDALFWLMLLDFVVLESRKKVPQGEEDQNPF